MYKENKIDIEITLNGLSHNANSNANFNEYAYFIRISKHNVKKKEYGDTCRRDVYNTNREVN